MWDVDINLLQYIHIIMLYTLNLVLYVSYSSIKLELMKKPVFINSGGKKGIKQIQVVALRWQ